MAVKTKKGLRQKEKGQSLIELAISLPVILLILLGTIDFGMALFSYAILRDAAQEGALYGSFNPTNKQAIENRARNILPRTDEESIFSSPVDLRNTDAVSVEIKTIGAACQGVTSGAANSIRVSVIYQYSIIMPFAGDIIGSDTIRLTGAATNVILQPPCP
ncbi:MAG: pilus assembly protein [Chloroflexi bacterium]|nr:pilus assembly protein [Chloroflexota bacterium]